MARNTKRAEEPTPIEVITSLGDTAYWEHSRLFYLMHELSRLVSTYFDKVMIDHRLTHAQWWALMHLHEHEGVTQSELASLMQMGRASTGKLLERLEAKHWIERRDDAADSRVRRVFLRDEVIPVFRVMTEEGKLLFRNFLAGVTGAEEAAVVAGLERIRANAERQLAGQPHGTVAD